VSGVMVLVMMCLLMLADLNENWGRKVLHAQPVRPGSGGLLKSWHEENRPVRIGRAMAVWPQRRLDNEKLQLAGL
jgi:hypothetical protein